MYIKGFSNSYFLTSFSFFGNSSATFLYINIQDCRISRNVMFKIFSPQMWQHFNIAVNKMMLTKSIYLFDVSLANITTQPLITIWLLKKYNCIV